MGHPGYVYRPHSKRRRKKQGDAARARLGIPDGFRRIYGLDVPVGEVADLLHRIVSARIRPDSLKYANPMRCVPRQIATEFATEVYYQLITNGEVSDRVVFAITKALCERHGLPWKKPRRHPDGRGRNPHALQIPRMPRI